MQILFLILLKDFLCRIFKPKQSFADNGSTCHLATGQVYRILRPWSKTWMRSEQGSIDRVNFNTRKTHCCLLTCNYTCFLIRINECFWDEYSVWCLLYGIHFSYQKHSISSTSITDQKWNKTLSSRKDEVDYRWRGTLSYSIYTLKHRCYKNRGTCTWNQIHVYCPEIIHLSPIGQWIIQCIIGRICILVLLFVCATICPKMFFFLYFEINVYKHYFLLPPPIAYMYVCVCFPEYWSLLKKPRTVFWF